MMPSLFNIYCKSWSSSIESISRNYKGEHGIEIHTKKISEGKTKRLMQRKYCLSYRDCHKVFTWKQDKQNKRHLQRKTSVYTYRSTPSLRLFFPFWNRNKYLHSSSKINTKRTSIPSKMYKKWLESNLVSSPTKPNPSSQRKNEGTLQRNIAHSREKKSPTKEVKSLGLL